MPRVHDRGGWPTDEPVDRSEHVLEDWERRVDAIVQVLARKRLMRVDELRRAIESLPADKYESFGYYQRWASAVETLMTEKNVLSMDEIERKMAELEEAWR